MRRAWYRAVDAYEEHLKARHVVNTVHIISLLGESCSDRSARSTSKPSTGRRSPIR